MHHRAVIVDDERLARREMRALLAAHPEVAVVGEAETIATAAAVVRAAEATVVFLDVQLERELGFDLLPLLEPEVAVVFVTAHERYAVRAFELHALDYLLKPVQRERLARALARLGAPGAGDAPEGPADSAPLGYDDFLFLRVDGRMRFLKLRRLAARATITRCSGSRPARGCACAGRSDTGRRDCRRGSSSASTGPRS
jgi:two-component system LytT family response regulator